MRIFLVKKTIIALALFSVFLGWFVWNSAWHLPSHLIIQGSVKTPVEAQISWDSGSGFNDMESAEVVFGKFSQMYAKSGVLKIRRIGMTDPAAKSADVRIRAMMRSEDSAPMPLAPFTSQAGVEMTSEGFLLLKENNDVLIVPSGKEWTEILFVMNSDSGSVEVDVDGDKRSYELYDEKPKYRRVTRNRAILTHGDFTARVNLPRYDIGSIRIQASEKDQAFQINSVKISSQKGELLLPVHESGMVSSISFSGIHRNTKKFFDPLHFIQQACFAAFCSYLLMYLWHLIRMSGGMKDFIVGDKRIAFWLMFTGAVICFFLWLMAHWPGHLTTDSIHIWWAAKQPGYFLHEHPFVNILYYRFLQQIWNHFAVVSVFQIVATALLGSYIFYTLHRNGLPLILIMPFYLWFITSVPIGLYNITLWKDIPFAILVVFWAFYFVRLRLYQINGLSEPRVSLFFLILLLLGVSLFRYNGMIYLILIPLGLIIYQRISLMKVVTVALAVSVMVAAGIFATSVMAKHDFVAGLTKSFAAQLRHTNLFKNINDIAKLYPDIFSDRNKYTWHRDPGVVSWHYAFTKEKKYNDFVQYYDYKPKSEAIFNFLDGLKRSSHKETYTWFTWNPFYLLYLFLLGVFFRWFPLVSSFGYILLTQVFFLLLFLSLIHGRPDFDWRYNYYLYLAGIFLIPLIMLDVKGIWQRHLSKA